MKKRRNPRRAARPTGPITDCRWIIHNLRGVNGSYSLSLLHGRHRKQNCGSVNHQVNIATRGRKPQQVASPSPRTDAWSCVEAVNICLGRDDQHYVMVKAGTCVLVPFGLYERTQTLGVARVEAILKDSQGSCQVALRWGWMASDIVDLDALTCPRVEPRYPRQIFWQKDLCEDGARHVGDANNWAEMQPCGDIAAVCTVLHRSQLTAASEQACMRPTPKPGQESRDPHQPEVFFYSMQYDSSVKHWEDCWLDEHAHLRQPPLRWKGLLPFLDVCCGMGAVSRAAQDLTSAARAGQAGSTDALQGFQVLGGVEKETDPCNAYLSNIMSAADPLNINRAVSLQDFNAGVVFQRETGRAPEWVRPGCRAPQAGEVGCLHASPPCQGVTPLNTKRNAASLSSSSGLFPLLAEVVRTVDLLRPAFFTLEEVPSFLAATVKALEGGSVTARCIWAVVLPLLDMGYQVDVRVLNAVHYGVPQNRPRVILFAAKQGYKLCCPPKPWNYSSADWSRRGPYLGEDAALINCADNTWRHISLSSDGLANTLPHAILAKEAIHDLPADVTPGSHVRVMAYGDSSPGRTSAFAKCMRSGQESLKLHWVGNHSTAAKQYMGLQHERAAYGQPFPVITGRLDAGSARAALCPRPGAQRLLTLAERSRLQALPDSLQPYGSTEAKLATQIGNAVPYPMAWAILGSVFEAAYGCAAPIPSYVVAERGGRSSLISCPTTVLETLCEGSCQVPPTEVEQLPEDGPMVANGQNRPARRWAAEQEAPQSFPAHAHGSFLEAAERSATSKGREDQLLCKRVKTVPTRDEDDEESSSCSNESIDSTEVLTLLESSSAHGPNSGTEYFSASNAAFTIGHDSGTDGKI